MNEKQLQMLIELRVITKGQAAQIRQVTKEMERLREQRDKAAKSVQNNSKLVRDLGRQEQKVIEIQNKVNAGRRDQVANLRRAEDKLKRLNNQYQKANRDVRSLDDQLGRLNDRLSRGGKEFKDVENGLKRQGVAIGKSVDRVQDFDRELKKLSDKRLRNLKENTDAARQGFERFNNVGTSGFESIERIMRRIITTLLTIAAIRVFGNLIRQGIEFEAAMVRVGAVARATADQFEQLVGRTREIARETIFTATQVSDVTRILAQAGFQVREILGSVQPILELTASTMGELAQTTELVASILRAFNLGIEETSRVVNVLTEATLNSRATIERLAVSFRFGGPAAAAFNQTVETTTAILARLTDLGLSASISGTTLRRAFIELSKGGRRQVEVLREINLSLSDVNPAINDLGEVLTTLARTTLTSEQAIRLFGARAGASMFALIQRIREGGETITEFADSLTRAAEVNRVAQIFERISDTVKAQSLITKSAFEELGLTIFEAVSPALRTLLEEIRERFLLLNETLNQDIGKNFQKSLQGIVPLITAMVDGLLKLTVVFTKIISVVGQIIASFAPFQKLFEGLVVLIGGLALKFTVWNGVILKSINLIKGFGVALTTTQAVAKATAAQIAISTKIAAIFGTTVRTATFAVRGLSIALGGIALTAVILGVEALIRLFSDTEDQMVQTENSFIEISDRIKFTEERLQSLSDQTRLTIQDQEDLRKAVEEGRIVFSEFGNSIRGVAVGDFSLSEIFDMSAPIDFSNATEQAILSLGKTELALQRVSKSVKEAGESIQGFRESSSQIDVGEIDVSGLNARDLIERFGIVSQEEIQRVLEQGFITTTRFIGSVEDESKKVIGTTESLLEQIQSNFKNADVGVEFIQQLSRQLENPEILEGISENFDAFVNREGRAFGREIARVFGVSFSENQEEILSLLGEARQLSADQEAFRLSVINSLNDGYRDNLALIEEQNQELEKSAEVIDLTLKNGKALRRNQSEINKLNEGRIATEEKIEEISAGILETIQEREEARQEGEKALALRLEAEINLRREQLKQLEQLNDEQQRQLDIINKILGNLDVARAKEELVSAEIALERKLRENASQELEAQQSLYDENIAGQMAINNLLLAGADNAGVLQSQIQGIRDRLVFRAEEGELTAIANEISVIENELQTVRSAQQNLKEAEIDAENRLRSLGINRLEDAKELFENNDARLKQLNDANDILSLIQQKESLLSDEQERQAKLLEARKQANEIINSRLKEAEDLLIKQTQQWNEINGFSYPEIENIIEAQTKVDEIKNQIELLSSELDVVSNEYGENSKAAQKIRNAIEQQNQALDNQSLILNAIVNKTKEKTLLDSQNAAVQQLKNAGLSVEAKVYEDIIEKQKLSKTITGAQGTEIAKINALISEGVIPQDTGEKLKSQIKEAAQAEYDLKFGGIKEQIGVGIRSGIQEGVEQAGGLKTLGERVQGLVAQGVQAGIGAVQDLASETIDELFGIGESAEEAQKEASELEKIQADLQKKLQENQRNHLNQMLELEFEHQRRLAEINSDFDAERREVEREIFNERAERMRELAALEQELRLQGLTTEEQRAELLKTIDQELANVRLGTIEQRESRLASLETQIKSLNELERSLGLTQQQIDQSSLQRLDTLQTETAAFYKAKQKEATDQLESQRESEIKAAQLEFKLNQERLRREKEIADQRARIDAELARNNIKNAKKTADAERNAIASVIKAVINEGIAFAITSALKKVELFPFNIVLAGVVAGTAAALFAGLRNFAKGGEVKRLEKFGGEKTVEIKRAVGGIIKGGHGGVDDIHTMLPEKSFVVNKKSTQNHIAELEQMTQGAKTISTKASQVPVAVTSGEFYIPPEVYKRNHQRIQEINHDKTGKTIEKHFYGGPVLGASRFQQGGFVNPVGSGETKNININNTFSFNYEGVNVVDENQEAVITGIYDRVIREKIRDDIENGTLQ